VFGKVGAEVRRGFAKVLVSQFGTLFSSKTALLIVFFTVLCLSLIAGWIPDGLNCLFLDDDCDKLNGLIMLVVAVLVLFALLFIGYIVVSPYKYAVVSTFPGKKRVLILFLSNINFRIEKEGELRKKLNELVNTLSRINTLEGRLEALNQTIFRSWRMPLEAVSYHLPVLERVVVITSKESSPQFSLFLELLKAVIPEARRIKVDEIKVKDFENFEEIQKAIERAYEKLLKEGYKKKEIILDVTGGKKIVSIVGAILSLNPGREFQYVSTTDYKVKSYDVEVVRDD